jgi:hypothetical protein
MLRCSYLPSPVFDPFCAQNKAFMMNFDTWMNFPLTRTKPLLSPHDNFPFFISDFRFSACMMNMNFIEDIFLVGESLCEIFMRHMRQSPWEIPWYWEQTSSHHISAFKLLSFILLSRYIKQLLASKWSLQMARSEAWKFFEQKSKFFL